MNTIEFKNNVETTYTKEHVEQIEMMEEKFIFSSFTSLDALRLGNLIIECSKKYGEECAFRIVRCKDDNIIFQYIGDTRAERNINFAKVKMNTVYKTGHCSFWAIVRELVYGDVEDVFEEESDCLPVGGAFPIYVDSEMVAVIGLSGLHHGNDQRLLVEAISTYLGVVVPEFTGTCI